MSYVDLDTRTVLAIFTGDITAPGVDMQEMRRTIEIINNRGRDENFFSALYNAHRSISIRMPFLSNIESRVDTTASEWTEWANRIIASIGNTITTEISPLNTTVRKNYDRHNPFMRVGTCIRRDGSRLQLVVLDDSFTCNRAYSVLPVLWDEAVGDYYIQCDTGRHYLEGQRTKSIMGDFYVGIWEYDPNIELPVVEYEETVRNVVRITLGDVTLFSKDAAE